MGLNGALHVGLTGLLSSQTALDVVGNNLANLGTKGYHRQTAVLAPNGAREIQPGTTVGQGVRLQQVIRHVDEALEGRLRNALSDESRSQIRQEVLTQIQSLENALDDEGNNITGQLQEFFAAWQNLQNDPQSPELRSLVVLQGQNLTTYLTNLRSELEATQTNVSQTLQNNVDQVNQMLTKISDLNTKIVKAEKGQGPSAYALRDERDQLMSDLAGYLDISTVEQADGAVNVYVGTIPVIQGSTNRGLSLELKLSGDQLQATLRITADNTIVAPTTGRLGALLTGYNQDVVGAVDMLDQLAGQLIWEVNRLHSQGEGLEGFATITAQNAVSDTTAALSDAAATGLNFTPGNGTFQITVRQKSTGTEKTEAINVSLKGLAGDTSLDSLAAEINAKLGASNVNASVTADGRLKIEATGGDFEVVFGQDTSGVLAALGFNTFFTGSDAVDISVNSQLVSNKSLLAAGLRDRTSGQVDAGGNAVAVRGLSAQALSGLDGSTFQGFWNRHVTEYAARLSGAQQQLSADTLVRENLQTQQASVSGANADEEAINLLSYQRAYQASARFLTVVDEMMTTLLNIM
ncbi:MAG: flagellar hook-associated protein FlgK [Phycisphaeraceae bacterium]|nr:flagellar hook-associated protein FlgK [Phycisphaeraceae bacterium]